ncbi:MAG: hypothetical protein DA408_03340 [Bacteroidetes bacterium]|nr:MAG: hypothetical protein C7N36_00510 [Bacteroidota bacterium]PTM14320.1 MAG: hypothetical protein DA408_03340 [Bacteroidota bacterium]
MNKKRHYVRLGVGLTALGICLLVRANPFFWDTVQLGAMQGDWFFQQGFSTFLLPDRIDSGHIPAFGWYLAGLWKVFGQSLLVSHLAMVPWVALVLGQILRLSSRVGKQYASLSVLLFLADPVLCSQLTMISPDVVLAGAFLLAVNSILNHQKGWLAISILLLGLVSLRGMLVGVGLFLWQVYRLRITPASISAKALVTTLLPYLGGGLVALAYLAFHFEQKGWVIVHEDSPWASSFAVGGIATGVKQLAILGWRMLDYGRVFLLLILLLAWRRSGWRWDNQVRDNVALIVILGIVLGIPGILSPGLAQHRYLLPLFLSITWLATVLLRSAVPKSWRAAFFTIGIIGLLNGNCWIYPNNVAQGWDATLAHQFYFEGRKNCKNFLSEENINTNEVGTVFPEVGPLHYRELNGIAAGFAPLDLAHQRYVYYSNVMNDFSDGQLAALAHDWRIIFDYQKGGVIVRVYEQTTRPLEQ